MNPSVRKEFQSHRVSIEGQAKIDEIRLRYSELLNLIEAVLPSPDRGIPPVPTVPDSKNGQIGRCVALARTELEQSSHWAIRAIAIAYETP